MTGIKRYYLLMQLYANLWTEYDFKTAFAFQFPKEYSSLVIRDYLNITDEQLIVCYDFLTAWQLEKND